MDFFEFLIFGVKFECIGLISLLKRALLKFLNNIFIQKETLAPKSFRLKNQKFSG
jgi:hypothetical protein